MDDSEVALKAICVVVESKTDLHIIDSAKDGREALDKVRRWRPEVVIMDIQMPVMNGITAAQVIQKEFPGTLVILVSMHDSRELRDASTSSGAHFICKDRMMELGSVVNDSLQQRGYLTAHG